MPPGTPLPPQGIHVTHIITRLIVGGAQENTLATVLGLHQRGPLLTDLISGPTTGPEGSLESTIAQSPHGPALTLIPSLVRPIHPWHDALACRRLVQLLSERRPQIVHTHSGKAGFLGRLAARRTLVPIVIHTIHGPSFGPFQSCFANTAFRTAERTAARWTTHYVAVAEAMIRQYLAAGIGSKNQYTRIFSGFELDPFLRANRDPALSQALGIDPSDVVIGKIARLFKLKGHDDLLEIAPGLLREEPRCKFLLVGDGAWRRRLEERAVALGIRPRIIFAGLVAPSEVPRYLALMDVLVHLSRREGLPRALPQACAAAVPVVSYDCDGAREICLPGRTGRLIRLGDLVGLSEALLALARDPALRQQLGREGQKFARTHFALGQMLDQLENLYLRLAKRHAAP
jgi:glycosyltransferase involved in cell wall biosynthesis